LRDAVEHGSRAIERIQIESARRPFAIVELIPAVATPARVAHGLHDASVTAVHGTIRAVNAAASRAVDFALQQVETRSR
jgi:hypothetical protein